MRGFLPTACAAAEPRRRGSLCGTIGRMWGTSRATGACGACLRIAIGTSTTIPLTSGLGMLTQVWSPYQLNPSNYHPLRELLQRIDFERLRDDASAPRVFICATNVRTGLRRVFHNAELSVDVLLASACLPQLYQAVQIGDDLYWDGGYTGNPALAPLYLGTSATDLIVVGINPMERTTVPADGARHHRPN